MFKIQLENGEFYKSKSGRVQHYKSNEKARVKIEKLGEIAAGATVVECKARTVETKKLEVKASDTKVVKASKAKKAVKAKKPDESVNRKKMNKNK